MIPAGQSAITAPNNTPAGKLRGKPEPVPTFSQQEGRERRRKRLITERVKDFTPSREVFEVADPLAQRIAALAALPTPPSVPSIALRFRRPVSDFADACHEFISGVIRWAAEDDARDRTRHLADEPGKRKYAMTTFCDLAQRPALPEITDTMVRDGPWAAALAEMAATADGLRAATTYSDRLERLLRDTVDRAALDLGRKVDWAESQPPTPPPARTDPRAELTALGIETPSPSRSSA